MLRAAVIGAGAIAREHLGCLRALPGVEIVGICDLSPALAEATAEEFGIPSWFTSRSRLLEAAPDAVHVTSPPHTHVEIATDALRAGCHVLCEKPITHDPKLLSGLFREADARGRMIVEDHNYAYNRPIRALLELVESGELGEVVHVDVDLALDVRSPGGRYVDPNLPHPCLRLPGGAIADFLTHLSYLAWLFVGRRGDVSTTWRKRDPESPLPYDELRALVEAERGTACLSFSSHARPDRFALEVEGTRLRARASLFEPLLALERVRGGPRPLLPVKNGIAAARAHWRCAWGGLWRKLSGRPLGYEGLHELVRRFYESAESGGPPPVSREQIVDTNDLVASLTAGLPARSAA